MVELSGKEGELKAVIQVTRKETGKVEEYTIVGKVKHEDMQELLKPETKEVK